MPSYAEVQVANFGPTRAEILSLTSYSDEEKAQRNHMSFAEANLLQAEAGGESDTEMDEARGWRVTANFFALRQD